MAHFALVNEQNIVENIIVLSNDDEENGVYFINTILGVPGRWIQTSYNTRAGVHYGPDGQPDGKPALRKNYACIGYYYDETRDAFIPRSGGPNWILNEEKCVYEPPIPMPDCPPDADYVYIWEDPLQEWLQVPKIY